MSTYKKLFSFFFQSSDNIGLCCEIIFFDLVLEASPQLEEALIRVALKEESLVGTNILQRFMLKSTLG